MLTNDIKIITSAYGGGQSLAFIQHSDSVSITGLLVASFDERSLNLSVTFQALWSLEYCISFVSGSDKLDYYTRSP